MLERGLKTYLDLKPYLGPVWGFRWVWPPSWGAPGKVLGEGVKNSKGLNLGLK